MARKAQGMKRWTPYIGGGVMIMTVAYGVYAFVQSTGGVQAPTVPEVQQISLVVPPPPPPPPEIEQPPEPVEEIEIPEPEPEPVADSADDEPPPGEDLGLDADGVAGSDGFGLKARKGGRSLIGGGDLNKWYAGLVQKDLQSALAAIDEIRKGRYTVVLNIWLSRDGVIEDSELVRGSGDAAIDQALASALNSGVRVSRQPPDDLPQPIKLRITSRT